MKHITILIVIFLVSAFHPLAAKSKKNRYIESASQFEDWCRSLSYRHFKRKKQQAYNWSASTIRQLNDYQTKGRWKVNNIEMKVFCQIRIGKKAKTTKIEIR